MHARHRKLQRTFAVGTALALGMGGALIASPAFADEADETVPLSGPAYEENVFDALADPNVVAAGRDADDNFVVKKVAGTETPDVTALEAEKTNVVVLEVPAVLKPFAENDVVGGAGYLIETPKGLGACSVGFSGWSPDGDPALISAGHCADGEVGALALSLPSEDPAVGGDGYVPTGPGLLGNFGFSQWGGPGNSAGASGDLSSIDISVIDVSDAGFTLLPEVTDWTTAASNDLAASATTVNAVGTPTLGATVEKSGRTTGNSEGPVTLVDGWANVGGHYVHGFEANLNAAQGDSGGAVIQGNTAVGLISGGDPDDPTGATWVAGLSNAMTYTDGYTVMLHVDAPAVSGPAAGTEVEPGTAITGTAPAGTTLVVTPASGDAFEVAVSASGAWSFPAPSTLGAYSFSAIAKNGFNESDSVSHELTIVAAPISAPVITSPADGAQINDSVTAINGGGLPGATVTVSGDVTGTAVVGSDGTWTIPADLSYGSYEISVKQATADQTSAEATSTFSVVLAAPAIVSPADGSEFADGSAPTLVSGTGVDGATVTVTVNGTAAGTAEVVDGVWELSIEGLVKTGETTITATQVVGDVTSVASTATITLAAPAPDGDGGAGDDNGTGEGDGDLAVTGGADFTPFIAVSALLLMIGGGLYVISRRRVSAVRTDI
ncbi:MAG TPA: hypothetical protein DIW46_02140 [Microbacterium sp.]|nr:hypothetical protein [Microbacterium sp.]